jgi:hypothetical protein
MNLVVRHEHQNLVHSISDVRDAAVDETDQILVTAKVALQNWFNQYRGDNLFFLSRSLASEQFAMSQKKKNHLYDFMRTMGTKREREKKLDLTVIWISRFATARSASLLTYILLSAYLTPLLPFTRNTIAKPPRIESDKRTAVSSFRWKKIIREECMGKIRAKSIR